MKTKTFLIAFLGSLVILLGGAALVYSQLMSIRALGSQDLADKLYQENINILALTMQKVDPSALEGLRLPSSWAEIMVVDNASLLISTSTTAAHKGQYLYKLPALLDQAQGIIKAMQNKQAATIKTADYMVAVRPQEGNTSLIGLKPKAWERNLIADQNRTTHQSIHKIRITMLIFVSAGLVVSLLIALIISLVAGKKVDAMLKAMEALSLGDLEAVPPADKSSFAASFLRIKASLTMALERLGE